jgi:hypothetical protein
MTRLPAPEIARELQATLAARRELGQEYDEHFLQALVEKLTAPVPQPASLRRDVQRGVTGCRNTAFALVSLVLAIPLAAIGVAGAGWMGLFVVALLVVGINFAVRSEHA